MKATKNTKTKKLEPQPTIGEYINDRLNSMAYGGHFGDPGCISPAAALPGIIDEYIGKFRVVRY